MPIVAEGVETRAQADMLIRLGCDFAQGWLFGRPVDADMIPEIVRTRGEWSLDPFPSDLSTNQRLAELEAVYAAVPFGLCFVDRQFRLIKANRKLADMLGRLDGSLIGARVDEIFPVSTETLMSDMDTSGAKLSIARYTVVLPGRNNPVELRVSAAQDEWGELNGFSMIVGA